MAKKLLYLIIVILLVVIAYNLGKTQISGNTKLPNEASSICSRSIPYNNPPEFTRAVSLINQRLNQAKMEELVYTPIINCLDIQYTNKDMDNAEGYFIFDPDSSINDLKIYVNPIYNKYDDILTALLLSHELRHVQQFVNFKTKGTNLDCYDNEIEAFMWQLAFLTYLNPEEQKSLYNRISQDQNLNSAYASTWKLLQIWNDTQDCNNSNTCVGGDTKQQITSMVKNNRYYQEQCKSN